MIPHYLKKETEFDRVKRRADSAFSVLCVFVFMTIAMMIAMAYFISDLNDQINQLHQQAYLTNNYLQHLEPFMNVDIEGAVGKSISSVTDISLMGFYEDVALPEGYRLNEIKPWVDNPDFVYIAD